MAAAQPQMQPAAEPVIIRDAKTLAQLTKEWRQLPAIAIDTEFERRSTFYSIPALVQIADGRRHYLVDPLAFDDFSALSELLAAPDTLKVLHACREDLQVLQCLAGVLPRPLFDTQVAAAFLGEQPQISYCRLAEKRLGITAIDGQTCSDWMQRPLTQAQLHYAMEDVRWLLPLQQQLEQDLQVQQRLDWVLEDCARIAVLLQPEQILQSMVQRLSGAGVPAGIRQRLQSLCAWREAQAQQRNIPRTWLLADELLTGLARRPARSMAELTARSGCTPQLLRRSGRELLALLAREPAAVPATAAPAHACGTLEKHIRREVAQRAQQLALAPNLLLSRRECRQAAHAMLGNGILPQCLHAGWRRRLLGDLLEPR